MEHHQPYGHVSKKFFFAYPFSTNLAQLGVHIHQILNLNVTKVVYTLNSKERENNNNNLVQKFSRGAAIFLMFIKVEVQPVQIFQLKVSEYCHV